MYADFMQLPTFSPQYSVLAQLEVIIVRMHRTVAWSLDCLVHLCPEITVGQVNLSANVTYFAVGFTNLKPTED
jgi:hypothetical protein